MTDAPAPWRSLPGPWQGEPDELDWTTAVGLRARIRRSPEIGALCGYVVVLPGHPAHGEDKRGVDVDVHGGLTFAGRHDADEPGWWLGFDCAHAGDLMPCTRLHLGGTYRDIAYVRAECESLARQLVAMQEAKP